MNTGEKTEKRFEFDGENEFSAAETGLKPEQTKTRFHPENKK